MINQKTFFSLLLAANSGLIFPAAARAATLSTSPLDSLQTNREKIQVDITEVNQPQQTETMLTADAQDVDYTYDADNDSDRAS